MQIRLLDIGQQDQPLIRSWLQAEHVRRYWGDAAENEHLVIQPPAGAWRALIEADGRKVGLIAWQHPTRQELDVAGLGDVPESVIDIDIMVGEADALGKGIGSAAIRLVAEKALADPAVPFVIGATEVGNISSQRAFIKAGFKIDREFDDVPNGQYFLMIRRR